jgi:hypothetical protein
LRILLDAGAGTVRRQHLVVRWVASLDVVCAHDTAPEDAVTTGFNASDDLSLVSLMGAASSWA